MKQKIASMQTRAAIEPTSVNADSRTAQVIWTTGERVLRSGWDGSYYEELSLDDSAVRMGRMVGAPLLMNHDSYSSDSHIGVIESAKITKGQGVADVKFSSRADVAPIFQDVVDGIRRQVSVGYRVYKYQEIPKAQGETIPTFRAVDWEPIEVSLVPIGADSGSQIRGEKPGELFDVEVDFVTAPSALIGRSLAMLTPEQIAEEQKREAEIKTASDAAIMQERKRIDDIQIAVRSAKLDASFADKLIKDGVSADAARSAVIDQLAKNQAAEQPNVRSAHVEVGTDAADKFAKGASDWLIIRAGHANKFANAKLDAGEFRGMTLLRLAEECLTRTGVQVRGVGPMELVNLALQNRGAQNTTSDFTYILENTLHKLLLASYAVTPDTWSKFCRTGTVTDFRAHNRYMLGSFGSLDAVAETGEFKTKQIPDAEKQSITATTKGNIIGISREAIVNDDMNAFDMLAMQLGRAAKYSVEKDVYTALASNSGLGPTLSDGKTVFHADHANIGSAAAISVTSIDSDRVYLGSQTDVSGNEVLDLRPSVLVLPIALGGTAKVINRSEYDPDTSNKLQRVNMVNNLFSDIVDTARLSGTRRYMFADPNIAPVLEVAFLNGVQEPYLEMQEGFEFNGLRWKVRADYAVAGVGYRGAVTNAGA